MGDFSGALLIAEGILEADPEDLEAPRYAQSCRDVLTQMYSARLGPLDQVVAVAVPSDQIRWLTLDHRAGFLLSLIDGGITVDQILDISGMTRLDAFAHHVPAARPARDFPRQLSRPRNGRAMRRVTQDLLIGAVFSAFSGLLLRALLLDTGALATSLPEPKAPAPAWPASSESAERVASYEIEAKLDSERHRIAGRETIHFVNRSSAVLNELWFHLYLNAFKNDKTLFLRSPFGAGRSGDKAHEYGYVDVKKLTVVAGAGAGTGEDLWAKRDRHSPDDPDDETDLRVPLPSPLEPGQTLDLLLEFEDQLPELVERSGFVGSFHFMGQWFPKLARLLPGGGFAHFAFHAQSEFYADFGDYDVTLDVPSGFQVGATGSRVRESTAKGRTQLGYHAENVHDFAWTAWDRFETRSERIAGTQVTVLYPPHQSQNAEAELKSVRFALPHFNALYGAYPYPTLTVVHPPEAAANAGGMEYPTLITTGGPWYSTLGGAHFIDVVTTHELGHQWFYGLLASNEHTEPFLDEGFNSYAEAEAWKRNTALARCLARLG